MKGRCLPCSYSHGEQGVKIIPDTKRTEGKLNSCFDQIVAFILSHFSLV